MKLAEVSVRRPVFTVMIIVALVVLGYTSFRDMNTDLMPEVNRQHGVRWSAMVFFGVLLFYIGEYLLHLVGG